MTNWETLESGETHMVFAFYNEAKNAAGEICERKGVYTLWAWRKNSPEKKTTREVSKSQAIELAAKMRTAEGNIVTFDKGAI
jgi:hypothetical protein